MAAANKIFFHQPSENVVTFSFCWLWEKNVPFCCIGGKMHTRRERHQAPLAKKKLQYHERFREQPESFLRLLTWVPAILFSLSGAESFPYANANANFVNSGRPDDIDPNEQGKVHKCVCVRQAETAIARASETSTRRMNHIGAYQDQVATSPRCVVGWAQS